MRSLINPFLCLILLLLTTSCQTTTGVAEDFREGVEEGDFKVSDKTSIIFLIDGLSSQTLKKALADKRLQNIPGYFPIPENGEFRLARATFPSLTFPNIASILIGDSVAHHRITGNRIPIDDDDQINFENVASWPVLAKLTKKKSIFHRLSKKGETSVSFSYPFPRGSSVHLEKSIDAGIHYLEANYPAIDTNAIESLENLLREKTWPRFIFVHLIGLDAISHNAGPTDTQVVAYLASLDSQLYETFELLRARKPKVQAVLTADHGFQKTDFIIPITQIVKRLGRDIRVIADNRVASLYAPKLNKAERRTLAAELTKTPHLSMTVVKSDSSLELFKPDGKRARIDFTNGSCLSGNMARFQWQDDKTARSFYCLEDFDKISSETNDSFIVPALVEYFQSKQAPDILLLPDDVSDFSGGYHGNHGGLTVNEMLVPLLTREVYLPQGPLPTWKLLKAMRLEPSRD